MYLRWSKFNHTFQKEGVTALYNALRIRPIFVRSDLIPILQSFGEGRTVSSVLATLNPELREIVATLIPVLSEAKILVSVESNDSDILGYFQAHHTGHPYVSIAYFILTEACNFGCKYCFVMNHMPASVSFTHMSAETARQGVHFFAQLAQLKPEYFDEEKTIVLYGGEPMVNPDTLKVLLEEVSKAKRQGHLPHKTQLSMVTNATLATPEIAELLAYYGVAVAVSIDGDKAATNASRQYRGGGTVFSDIIKGFETLRSAGVNPGVSCTLSQASLDRFSETKKFIIDELGVTNLGFNIVISSEGLGLALDYDLRASQAIIEAFKEFRKRGIAEDQIMRKVDFFIKGEIYPFDCGATGGGQIVVAPDGQVGICHGYIGQRKYFVTNTSDGSFDPSEDPTFLEWAKRSPLNMPECVECPALGICGGGCPLNADYETGSIWGLDSHFCTHALTTLEWLIWDLFDQIKQTT